MLYFGMQKAINFMLLKTNKKNIIVIIGFSVILTHSFFQILGHCGDVYLMANGHHGWHEWLVPCASSHH